MADALSSADRAKIVAKARDQYGSDDIDVDSGAELSVPEDGDGAFVQAWVWVRFEDADVVGPGMVKCGYCEEVVEKGESSPCQICEKETCEDCLDEDGNCPDCREEGEHQKRHRDRHRLRRWQLRALRR